MKHQTKTRHNGVPLLLHFGERASAIGPSFEYDEDKGINLVQFGRTEVPAVEFYGAAQTQTETAAAPETSDRD